MDTTGQALVDFWKWAGDKGLVNENTANARSTACNKVLGVVEGWEKLDVSALDTDDVLRRFMNKRAKDFTPGSLNSYKSRFLQALEEFMKYTKSPETWKPSTESRTVTAKKDKPAAKNGNGTPTPEPVVETQHPGRVGLVEYPFPLREGRFAYLKLPADLKMADVKRLTTYLNALASDDAEVA
jgi:hypothetical protein